MKDGQLRSQFRIPVALHDRLTASAQRSGRSMNAEIIYRLEQTFVPATTNVQADIDLKNELHKAVANSIIGKVLTAEEVGRVVERMIANVSQK